MLPWHYKKQTSPSQQPPCTYNSHKMKGRIKAVRWPLIFCFFRICINIYVVIQPNLSTYIIKSLSLYSLPVILENKFVIIAMQVRNSSLKMVTQYTL